MPPDDEDVPTDSRFLRFTWNKRTVNLNFGGPWPPPEVIWVGTADGGESWLVTTEQVADWQVRMVRTNYSKIGLLEDDTPDPDFTPMSHVARGAQYAQDEALCRICGHWRRWHEERGCHLGGGMDEGCDCPGFEEAR